MRWFDRRCARRSVHGEVELVGGGRHARGSLRAGALIRPDILLLDIDLPG